MNVTHLPPIDHHGAFSKKRMNLQPTLPIPVTYASAAIPTYAPFGTEYTPGQTIKIVGGHRILIPDSIARIPGESLTKTFDPDISPTKSIQHVHAIDNPQWPQHSKQRFDTTYRTEYTNRIRHPEYIPWYQQNFPNELVRPTRHPKGPLNNLFVLPPITSRNNDYNEGSAYNNRTDVPQQLFKDQEVPSNEMMSNGVPLLNLYDQQRQQQGMMNDGDTYLPAEPVLLTDYEDQGLCEQIRSQLGNPNVVDRLKLFYQELTKYDPNATNYVHYSHIQLIASQLGLNFEEDTLRFAMCKFVSPDRPRGYVNYEDLVRYFGRCLSAIYPNQYAPQQNVSPTMNGYYNQSLTPQNQYQTGMKFDNGNFDPDERQIRILLKQNLKTLQMNGSVDFDKLYNELKLADRNQTGVLNRQQIEEGVYKVRIPLQRSLIFQILEKHCRAYARLYRWNAFVQYLKQQAFDLQETPDRSNSIYTQNNPDRIQWLEQLRREYKERARQEIIQRYIENNEEPRLESKHSSAWFTRFLRLANAMYNHRTSTNREQDFVLPREEARRHFRAYNHVWDLQISEEKLQRILDSCARNANTAIDDALRLLAK